MFRKPVLLPFDCPGLRQIVDVFSLDEEKSVLEKTVLGHHFNHALDIIIPSESASFDELFVESEWEYYLVHDMTLHKFVDPDFIGAFVKNGKICALSINTNIDVDNCVCLYDPGTLVLSLNKDDYEEMGLQGKPSKYSRKLPSKYVVKIDLADNSFTQGKKLYDRVAKVFKEKAHMKFEVVFSWVPHANDISSRSLYSYLQKLNCDVEICLPEKQVHMGNKVRFCNMTFLRQMKFGSDLVKCETKFFSFLHWIGKVFCQTTCEMKTNPKTSLATSRVSLTGFLPAENILKVMNDLRSKRLYPWIAVVVHGFDDSPVSWGDMEHGFEQYGDNLYIACFFNDSRCWLCKIAGARDDIPYMNCTKNYPKVLKRKRKKK